MDSQQKYVLKHNFPVLKHTFPSPNSYVNFITPGIRWVRFYNPHQTTHGSAYSSSRNIIPQGKSNLLGVWALSCKHHNSIPDSTEKRDATLGLCESLKMKDR